jgi:hypothetical protein
MRKVVREESADALEGMKKHVANVDSKVASLDAKLSSVDGETRAQTGIINAIKVHTDMLIGNATENAAERGRRSAREEDLAKRETEAEIALKQWQKRAIPIGFVIAGLTALITYLAKGH